MAGTGTVHLRDGDQALLRVEDLVVEFPVPGTEFKVHAVSGISLDVLEGETLGLVGESGCGKSTTGKAILQAPRPTSGSVRFDGKELTAMGAEEVRSQRPRLQMIFQDPISSLNPRRTVGDIVGDPVDIWWAEGFPRSPVIGVFGQYRVWIATWLNKLAKWGSYGVPILALAAVFWVVHAGAKDPDTGDNSIGWALGLSKILAAVSLPFLVPAVAALAVGGLVWLLFLFVMPFAAMPRWLKMRGARAEHKAETNARVAEVLESVGINAEDAMDRRRHEFSGGQAQRISVARALMLNPKVIVCDEPVSALDVSVQAQILNLLEDMKAQYGLTLIFIGHDLAVVKNISDRIAVMYLGKLCEVASPDDLYHEPRHPYSAALLAAVPVPDPEFAPDANTGLAGELPSPISPPSGCRFRTRCPRAEAKCAAEEPTMTEISDRHYVACHFPLAPGEKLEGLGEPETLVGADQ